MTSLKAIIYELLTENSDAAELAHSLGLIAGGWGTWKDKTGHTVAKTVRGNLVKIEDVDAFDFEDDVNDFAQEMRNQYPLKKFELNINPHTGDLRLDSIIIDKSNQGQGIGTKVMQELTRYADAHHKRLTLTPAEKNKEHGTTSSSRLQKFYKQFGFSQNQGRHTDFRTSDSMIRPAK